MVADVPRHGIDWWCDSASLRRVPVRVDVTRLLFATALSLAQGGKGPNFAFDLCVRRSTAEQRASLDLSSWSIAFNGAEPIRQETLKQFAETFEPCGFRSHALYPCYGLAEATLIVSGRLKSNPAVVKLVDGRLLESGRAVDAVAGSERERPLVSSGHPPADEKVIVVNPETLTECGQDEVGEIWVSSRSVALGYWDRPDETTRTFRAHLSTGEGPFLRTGDLGFIRDNEIFITGRLKDLIIIRGRNHYPQDIEFSGKVVIPPYDLLQERRFRLMLMAKNG